MGIFDQMKSKAQSQIKTAARSAMQNMGNQRETFTFTALPESVAQMQALPEAAMDTLRLRSASESPVNWTRSTETASTAPGTIRVDVRTRHTSPSVSVRTRRLEAPSWKLRVSIHAPFAPGRETETTRPRWS